MTTRFDPRSHVPQFSRLLWESIRTPMVMYFILAGMLVMVSGSIAFYFVESETNPAVSTILDAFWWGMATVTTVGFGDIVPHTLAGRLIGFALISTGALLFVGSSAILSSTFFARTQSELLTLEDQSKEGWQVVLTELKALREEVAQLRNGSN